MGKDSEKGEYAPPEGSHIWEYISSAFIAILAFTFGQLMGWNAPSLAELKAPNSTFQITDSQESTLAASLAIGQALAPPFGIFIFHRIGSKTGILISTIPVALSWIMILLAKNISVLIAARILAGYGVGLSMCVFPIYTGEILSKHLRGSQGAVTIVMFNAGLLFIFATGPYLGIKISAWIGLTLNIIFFVSFWFAPESPYFLVKVGKIEAAEAALEKLRGKTDVTEEIELIKATIKDKGISLQDKKISEKSVSSGKWNAVVQLFTIRGNIKAFGISMILAVMTHFSGFSGLMSFCPHIFKDMGSNMEVNNSVTSFGVIQMISGIITIGIVNRIGRRPIFFISTAVTAFCLSVIAVYFFLLDHMEVDVKPYYLIPYATIFLYVMAVNVSCITIPGIIMSEIFATDVKALASCIYAMIGGLIGFLTVKAYMLTYKIWGLGHSMPFFIYALVTAMCAIPLVRLLPETRGKTFLEIQKKLNA
ncbi:facilitated trehalose transporter Tret1-like [Diprion similis]|uniref:facilitated trehalose transporter Tret1-like n=1 Tax=Diprion similis TaxID=362088 RepID=UPI001EF8F3CE|nr:facilitated trehalose transporter Tret1-like [Diprion similis]